MPSSSSSQKLLVALFVATLAGCGGGSSSDSSVAAPTPPAPAPAPVPTPPTTSGTATQYAITVTLTDPGLDPSFGQHYAYVNSTATRVNKLFVFFPATASNPANYNYIGLAAANSGFNSIGLAYPNAAPVDMLCSGSTDPDCTTKIREETYAGTDQTPLVTISPTDSVVNRLTKLLIYLKNTNPASEGWAQYLDSNNNIRWDLIRVSGLSQGGGLAGYIGKIKQTVDRICYFSSPADWDGIHNQPAGWVMSATALTPANRIYGFNNLQDPIVPYPHILKTWTAFELDQFGSALSVDNALTYNATHELNTNLGDSSSAHTMTASDLNTPVVNGVPVYLPVWQYTCFN